MLAETETVWTVAAKLIPVVGGVLLAWIAYKQVVFGREQAAQGKVVKELEKNTNSMKDALVNTTGESEKAKGKLEGAQEEQAKVALKAEGAKEAKDAKP